MLSRLQKGVVRSGERHNQRWISRVHALKRVARRFAQLGLPWSVTLNLLLYIFTHNLNPFLGGMLQSWNKLCFTGGRVEMSVSLPGIPSITRFAPTLFYFEA